MWTTVDLKLFMRLDKVSTAFSSLAKQVWNSHHLCILIEVLVYETCVLSILLYRAESWARLGPQESKLSAFHASNLRLMLNESWEEQMTNEEAFRLTGFEPLLSELKFFCVCWVRHVNKMAQHRIPRLLLHGVPEKRTRETKMLLLWSNEIWMTLIFNL